MRMHLHDWRSVDVLCSQQTQQKDKTTNEKHKKHIGEFRHNTANVVGVLSTELNIQQTVCW